MSKLNDLLEDWGFEALSEKRRQTPALPEEKDVFISTDILGQYGGLVTNTDTVGIKAMIFQEGRLTHTRETELTDEEKFKLIFNDCFDYTDEYLKSVTKSAPTKH